MECCGVQREVAVGGGVSISELVLALRRTFHNQNASTTSCDLLIRAFLFTKSFPCKFVAFLLPTFSANIY